MTEMRAELTGENVMSCGTDLDGRRTSWFEAVLTDENKLMIIHHVPIEYDGIVLNLDGTSALDKLLAEMYRRKMND